MTEGNEGRFPLAENIPCFKPSTISMAKRRRVSTCLALLFSMLQTDLQSRRDNPERKGPEAPHLRPMLRRRSFPYALNTKIAVACLHLTAT